jgi:hypothetical protein
VTGTLIAPVIPSSAAARPARAPAAARTLPLTVPPVRPPALPRDVVYGLAHVDRSGRVADRTVTGALGWCGGDRLTLTAEAGVVVIRRDPSGLVTLPPRSCVPIPAALRHRCGLPSATPRLTAASPSGSADGTAPSSIRGAASSRSAAASRIPPAPLRPCMRSLRSRLRD